MDLTKPNLHWLYNRFYKHRSFSILNEGLNSSVDGHHMWTIFTMYWPAIFACWLHGKE